MTGLQREQIQQLFHRLRSSDPPRTLLVYAHPDDEAIAVAGHLPLFRNALFVQVTDGAPVDNTDGIRLGLTRDEYRATRALELRSAFAAAGVPEAQHRCLNLSDKEAALHLPELIEQIAHIIRTEQPEAIFTHPYENGHADHDSTAFAVHQAVAGISSNAPVILESPFYFRSPGGGIHTGSFLHEDPENTVSLPLSPGQQQGKRAAFAAFSTQQHVLQDFDAVLREERFRVAPAYDFTRPATSGPAFYESFIPLTAVRFAELATEAINTRSGREPKTFAA